MAILKNDLQFKSLGFSPIESDLTKILKAEKNLSDSKQIKLI
jgi:predicted phosphoadenosine phosphosulfate sulfurtransferase